MTPIIPNESRKQALFAPGVTLLA